MVCMINLRSCIGYNIYNNIHCVKILYAKKKSNDLSAEISASGTARYVEVEGVDGNDWR